MRADVSIGYVVLLSMMRVSAAYIGNSIYEGAWSHLNIEDSYSFFSNHSTLSHFIAHR